ncbi:hypothetical protein BGZ61DRAFT_471350 [Ilyonectria robusta]|uniref:uncharacterized protein n=1 Tax=Ilyonectria robusta TaxID=1079257 RepID=UPI001E8D4A1B|nr:uncharacterized protein BGZ61DRAFT_471350 [Ilyonectria robusta]KAH8737971.1 hypothetical protein BGZ61DRAFT_471350 [Ilyonectria robusta]
MGDASRADVTGRRAVWLVGQFLWCVSHILPLAQPRLAQPSQPHACIEAAQLCGRHGHDASDAHPHVRGRDVPMAHAGAPCTRRDDTRGPIGDSFNAGAWVVLVLSALCSAVILVMVY